MIYLKWAQGAQNIDWFANNGTPISNNTFNVNQVGIHTVFYETANGEKRVYTFNVTQENLPMTQWIYGFTINESEINPDRGVVYTNDSTDFTPASRKFSDNPLVSWNSWKDKAPFNQIKPCVLDNITGKVKYYLDPLNYAKKADGSPAIIDGSDGDVMVEFPKIYWKVQKTGTIVSVNMSNTQVDSSWKCYGHMQGNTEFNKLYISAYMVWNVPAGIKSASGLSSSGSVSVPRTEFINLIKQRNSGYRIMHFHAYSLMQMLCILFFKARDIQNALGFGKSSGNNTIVSGHSDATDLFYGYIDITKGVKALGIEDLWGNTTSYLEGLYSDVNGNISWANDNLNENGIGYKASGFTIPYNAVGYVDKVAGTTELPFVPISVYNTTSSYYYADRVNFAHSLGDRLFTSGGYYPVNSNSAGLFFHNGSNPTSPMSTARIMYLSN